jgi:hypothetical protein
MQVCHTAPRTVQRLEALVRVEQRHWTGDRGWALVGGERCERAQLVLVFGATAPMAGEVWTEIRAMWPDARLVGCSTAGEIAGTVVCDDTIVATALKLERSQVRVESIRLCDTKDGFTAGRALASRLNAPDLCHVFVISDGLNVNGSELARGLAGALPPRVGVTGGLAGDGSRFERTLVALDGPPDAERIVAVGFYGHGLRVGFGSLGGWDPFGPERVVTRARGAVLYELDGQPALELYKRYLGEHAAQLPSSGLLFPLTVRRANERGVVRTILSIDERQQSLTFAGEVPEGALAQLMHANFDRLVEGASGAAQSCVPALDDRAPDVALLISCVGRKLVLQQRVEEEIEAVHHVLGDGPLLAGFYSYGEIAPFTPAQPCELHNQTMTITTLREE